MKYLKLSILAVLLSAGLVNNSHAQSKGPGIDGCFVQTMNWSASQSKRVISLNVDARFAYADISVNGQFYMRIYSSSFYVSDSIHGSVKVVGYTLTNGCSKQLLTVTL